MQSPTYHPHSIDNLTNQQLIQLEYLQPTNHLDFNSQYQPMRNSHYNKKLTQCLNEDSFRNKLNYLNLDAGVLEPWKESNDQITQYHKIQEQIKLKLKLKKNISYLKTLPNDKTPKTEKGSRCTSRTIQNQTNLHSHKNYSGKNQTDYQCEENDMVFCTISTSNQQKLKWQLEMQVMMKRRKRISNMLKIRHFGYLKQNFPTQNSSQNKNKSRLDNWKKMLEIVEDQPNNCEENLQTKIKTQRSVDNIKIKGENHELSMENLYSVLKTYTHRKEVKNRMSHNFTKNKSRSNSATQKNFMQPGLIQITSMEPNKIHPKFSHEVPSPRNDIKSRSQLHSSINHIQIKERFSECLSNRRKHNQTFHTFEENKYRKSVSLNQKQYAGQSIKNKLRLLKSNHKADKNKSKKNYGQFKVIRVEQSVSFK